MYTLIARCLAYTHIFFLASFENRRAEQNQAFQTSPSGHFLGLQSLPEVIVKVEGDCAHMQILAAGRSPGLADNHHPAEGKTEK